MLLTLHSNSEMRVSYSNSFDECITCIYFSGFPRRPEDRQNHAVVYILKKMMHRTDALLLEQHVVMLFHSNRRRCAVTQWNVFGGTFFTVFSGLTLCRKVVTSQYIC